jgi:diadenosine tetraphosphate (Ap4A) HIT family hydrolase
MDPASCPFCHKLAALTEQPEAEIVWQFPHSVAFLGAWQFYTGYCVLVARRHAHELSELGDDERRAYLEEMCLLARAIEGSFRPHKLNYELLGNQVPHLHWHLFPRAADDPGRLDPVWLALKVAEHDESLRHRLTGDPRRRGETTAALRQALEGLGATWA